MEIGTLITGAGVVTTISKPYTPAYILIGAVDDAMALRAISVTIGGTVTIKINTLANISAFAQFLMQGLLGADIKVGLLIKIADDFISDQNLELSLTNDGVTTPTIFGFSRGKTNMEVVRVGQETIQATSSLEYNGNFFSGLLIPDTNLDYVQITFSDGHSEKMSGVELDALFALENIADANGQLTAVHVIDNSLGDVASVIVFSDAGGDLTITQMTK